MFTAKHFSKIPKPLVNHITHAYVMSKYLQQFCGLVGEKLYKTSPIRLEHGTGTGFFGISNTGSSDCIKERFRGVTDSLGLKFDSIDSVFLRSGSCRDVKVRETKLHRVEHTKELNQMFREFEELFLIRQRPFTANDMARLIIENQIVCLIEQSEQKTGGILKNTYDKAMPFSKYTAEIFCKNLNVSKFSNKDILEMNQQIYAELLKLIAQHDFSSAIEKVRNKIILNDQNSPPKKHTLPPLRLASKYTNCEFSLLKYHYHHKLNKRLDISSRWYNKADANRYVRWLEMNE
jgi:hypothetical protein